MTRNASTPLGLFVGMAAVDLTYPVDEIPKPNQKIAVARQRLGVGGPATTAAVTFSLLGGRSNLVTAVGRHPLGDVIRRDLKQHSVELHDIARDLGEPPPVSSIFVIRSTGERTVVSANAAAFPSLDTEVDLSWLAGVSIVEVDGHYMPLCMGIARLARARSIPVVLDSGSWKDGMDELLPSVSIAICSDDFHPPGCRDTSDVMEFLSSQGIHQTAITRGSDPILFSDAGQRGEIPTEPVRAVDTLGAGDIFYGSFCYYAAHSDHSFPDSLVFAGRVASLSCQYSGTRSWMKSFPATEAVRP